MLPGSHTGHEELCERLQWTGGDFVPLPGGDPLLELPPKLVVAKAGDLILWDSEWCSPAAGSTPSALLTCQDVQGTALSRRRAVWFVASPPLLQSQ